MPSNEYKFLLTGDSSGLRRAVGQGVDAFGKLGRELGAVQAVAAKALSFAGLGGAATAAGIVKMATDVASLSKELTTLAALSNTGVEEFQRLAYAAQTVGVEQGKLADIYKDMSDRVGEFVETGSGPLADFFDNIAPQVGVTAESFRRLSGPEALQLFYDSLEKAGVSANQITFYMEAIASDSAALVPLLRENGRGFLELGDQAERLGKVMSSDLIKKGKDLDANLNALKSMSEGVAISIGASIVPALTDLAAATLSATEAQDGLSKSGTLELWANSAATAIAFVIDVLDGAYRVLEVIGTGIAGYAAMLVQVAKGDLSAAKDTFAQISQDVALIMSREQFSTKLEEARRKGAANAVKIEQGAAAELTRLERQKAAEVKRLQDGTNAERKKALSDELSGAQKLKDALQSAWQESINGAREAAKEAANLLDQADRALKNRQQQADDLRNAGLPDDERESIGSRRARDLTDEARRAAVFAQNAAISGRADDAQRLADAALETAKQAADVAGSLQDKDFAASIIEQIGQIERDATAAQAKIKQNESEALAEQAAAQQTELQKVQAQIDELTKKSDMAVTIDTEKAKASIDELDRKITTLRAKLDPLNAPAAAPAAAPSGEAAPAQNIEVSADVVQAETAIDAVQAAVNALPDKKQIVIETVTSGTTTFSDAASDWNAAQNGFYAGGYTGPGGKYQPAGIVHAGEFVHRQEVVRQPGALAFLAEFNRVGMAALLRHQMRGYASGGLVAARAQALSSTVPPLSPSSSGAAAGGRPIVLQWPDGSTANVTAQADVARQIERTFARAALKRGSRRAGGGA